jgi:hypothetical protein
MLLGGPWVQEGNSTSSTPRQWQERFVDLQSSLEVCLGWQSDWCCICMRRYYQWLFLFSFMQPWSWIKAVSYKSLPPQEEPLFWWSGGEFLFREQRVSKRPTFQTAKQAAHCYNSAGQLIIINLDLRFGLMVPSCGAFWLAQSKSKLKVETKSPNRTNTKVQAGTVTPNQISRVKNWIWSYGLDFPFQLLATSTQVNTW